MNPPVLISERQADYQDTEKSTAQTVEMMCQHIRDGLRDPEVMRAAIDAVNESGINGCRTREQFATAVWAWCKRNIEFVQDEQQLAEQLGRANELELLIAPAVLVRMDQKRGDCDDFTMMACAMLACLGVPPIICTFKCDAKEPWRWAHVCAAAVLEDGSIFPVDASHGKYAGWRVPDSHAFATQLWDLNGKRVGVPMQRPRRKGLGDYQRMPSWTGDPMSTVSGPLAGPYPGGDVMRYWYPGPRQSRSAKLQNIAKGKFTGMGSCVGGFDEFGVACTDFTPITSDPNATAAALQYLNTPTGTLAGSTAPSAGAFNWNNFFGNLLGAGTTVARTALGPNGQPIVVASAPASTIGGISTSTLLIGAVVLGAVVLLAGKK